jgi:hypothetical protein
MAMRSRTTFKKRQKELARQEKQRDKAARRLERKLHKHALETGEISEEEESGDGEAPLEAAASAAEAHHTADAP